MFDIFFFFKTYFCCLQCLVANEELRVYSFASNLVSFRRFLKVASGTLVVTVPWQYNFRCVRNWDHIYQAISCPGRNQLPHTEVELAYHIVISAMTTVQKYKCSGRSELVMGTWLWGSITCTWSNNDKSPKVVRIYSGHSGFLTEWARL